MRVAEVIVFLLLMVSNSRGQATVGGLSFPGTSGGTVPAHFGVNNPSFPAIDYRTSNDSSATHSSTVGTLPNAYPVQPQRFGREASIDADRPGIPGHQPLVVAFKNHTVASATAMWRGGDTLCYLNSKDVLRIVPMKHIDWEATKRLNPAQSQLPIPRPGE